MKEMINCEERIYETLEKLGITDYTIMEHEAIYHSEEAAEKGLILDGITPKNLLLKKKKTNKYYMVITDWRTPADLKKLRKIASWGQVRFAREEEMQHLLGIGAGAITPLALINDTEHIITAVIAADITSAEDEAKINVHPGRNTATLSMKKTDLLRYLQEIGCEIIIEPYA